MRTESLEPGCLARIRARVGSFTPAEKRIADLILSDSNSIILSSAKELAERCNASEAAISRFSRRIGFGGFPELKVFLAQDLVAPDRRVHEDIQPSERMDGVKQKVTEATIRALSDTLAVLDSKVLNKAADILSAAERIVFVGVGGSGVLALDAKHSFMRTGKTVFAITDAHEQAMFAALCREGDAVVVISHSGATKDLIETVDLAKYNGARTIAITRLGTPPLGRKADVHLCTSARETLYRPEALSSRIAALGILDILFVGLCQRHNETILENLNKIRTAVGGMKL